jgi:hypothetical protein
VTSATAQNAQRVDSSASLPAKQGNQVQTVATAGGGKTGGTTGQSTGGKPKGGETNATTLATSKQPAIDTAAISAELGTFIDDLGGTAQKVASVRSKGTSIYQNERVPTDLRAEAAVDVATAYNIENNQSEACRWVSMALQLRPAYSTATKLKAKLDCP